MPNYQLIDDLTLRTIKNEHFVFDRNTGIVHTFNETGKFIWKQISIQKPFIDIIKNLVEEYDISEENAKIEIFDFILELEKKQILKLLD